MAGAKPVEEGAVEAPSSPSAVEPNVLEKLLAAVEKMAERLDTVERRPVLPVAAAGKIPFARDPKDVLAETLARIHNPEDMAGDSAVWDPLAEYGFSLQFSDGQLVEVLDEEFRMAYVDKGLLAPEARMIGIIDTLTHRHSVTKEPKYRVIFGEGIADDCFMESLLCAYIP